MPSEEETFWSVGICVGIAGDIYMVFWQHAKAKFQELESQRPEDFQHFFATEQVERLLYWPCRGHIPLNREYLKHFACTPEKALLLMCLRARVSRQLKFLVTWRIAS